MSKPSVFRRYMLVILIAIGLLIGLTVGFAILYTVPEEIRPAYASWFKVLGDVLVRLIKIIIPPVILFTITAAVCTIADLRRLGKTLGLILVLYIITSYIAAGLGIVAASIFRPGEGIALPLPEKYTPPKPLSPQELVLYFFKPELYYLFTVKGAPTLILIAIILGIGIVLLGDRGRPIAKFFDIMSDLMIRTLRVIMWYTPVAVFGYAVWLISTYGPAMLGAYGKFLAAQYSLTAVHILFVYTPIVALAGLNPLKYYKEQSEPFLVAYSTRSSAVTLPYNMAAAKRMGVRDEIFRLTLPIGATVNMDGTALYQALSTLFIAQLFGITIGPYQAFLLMTMAVIVSAACAAVPGAGPIMLAIMLSTFGLPLEGVAIMLVVDPISDAMRTATNVSGDNACTLLLSRMLGYKPTPLS